MARFIHGSELNAEIEKLIRNSQKYLFLASPYIKLHPRVKEYLLTRKDDDKLFILVLFGKNQEDVSKSLSLDDLQFFYQFPNIQVRYEPRLHAKYYANETVQIFTSMNLHMYSMDNNIEAGVLTENSILGEIKKAINGDKLGEEAYQYFKSVFNQAELILQKVPEYKSSTLSIRKKYTHSNVLKDNINEFFSKSASQKSSARTKKKQETSTGFCIRTGVEIPFNISRPYSDSGYASWVKFGNKDYPEKYCHYSGEPSEGETSFEKPVLKKYWNNVKNKSKSGNYTDLII